MRISVLKEAANFIHEFYLIKHCSMNSTNQNIPSFNNVWPLLGCIDTDEILTFTLKSTWRNAPIWLCITRVTSGKLNHDFKKNVIVEWFVMFSGIWHFGPSLQYRIRRRVRLTGSLVLKSEVNNTCTPVSRHISKKAGKLIWIIVILHRMLQIRWCTRVVHIFKLL